MLSSVYVSVPFESSVNSYDSQTQLQKVLPKLVFESSVNSYDSQTMG